MTDRTMLEALRSMRQDINLLKRRRMGGRGDGGGATAPLVWDDLSGYLMSGYSGLFRGSIQGNVMTLTGNITGTAAPRTSVNFADNLPTKYLPATLTAWGAGWATGGIPITAFVRAANSCALVHNGPSNIASFQFTITTLID